MITHRNAFVVFLITSLYTPQSTLVVAEGNVIRVSSGTELPTNTTVAVTPGPTVFQIVSFTRDASPFSWPQLGECTQCYVAMGTSSGTVQGLAIIVLTAYSTTRVSSFQAECVTTSGAPVTLPKGYTITSPTTVLSSDFPAYAGSEFLDFLGFSTCVRSGEELLPTSIIHVANISVTPTPSASLRVGATSTTSLPLYSNSATNPIATPRLDKPTKIGIGIGISLAAILLISFVAVIRGKRRLRAAAITAGDEQNTKNKKEGTSASLGDGQPYLQQKAELEAEEQQRHEIEAWQKIYELDGENEVKEFPGGVYEHRLAVMRTRQELRGGEHGQELDS